MSRMNKDSLQSKEKFKVLALSGALEKQSLVKGVLQRAMNLNPYLHFEIIQLHDIPLLNTDLFKETFPFELSVLRTKADQADAILACSYVWMGKMSPALKNAIDWLTYSPNPQVPSPIRGMPVGLITLDQQEDGASAQKHLLAVSQFSRMKVMSKPTLHYQFREEEIFGGSSQLQGGRRIQELVEYLEYFYDYIGKKRRVCE